MRSIPVSTLQQGLIHFGFDPGPVDNSFGPLTRAALNSWIDTLPPVPGHPVLADNPITGSRSIGVAEPLAVMLEEAAQAYRARTPARTRSTSGGGSSTAVVTTGAGAPFWRRDNIWMWLLLATAAGGASAGMYWYGRKRRWF